MLRPDAVPKKRQLLMGLALFLCLSITACSRSEPLVERIPAGQCIADTSKLPRYSVKRVVDGDTLQLGNGDMVRLIGINTPELGRGGRSDEALARKAQRALARRLEEGQVWLETGEQGRDKYGRRLAYAFDARGLSLSGALLADGLGFQVAIAPNFSYFECLQAQETRARNAGRGVWGEPDYAARSIAQLQPGQGGFQRVRDRVIRVSFKDNGWWLQLGGKLGVKIDVDAQPLFPRDELQGLEGRDVEVRGWLVPMRGNWWMMNLDHPEMLRRH